MRESNRGLLICSRHIATASGICCTHNNNTDIYRKSQGDKLSVTPLAALAPPIK